jgi:hypothetical protein
MSIVVLSATLSLSCFAPRARPTKRSLARAVTRALNEYFPVSPLFLRAVKERLPRLVEALPAVHAPPQVVPVVKCSSLTRNYREPE